MISNSFHTAPFARSLFNEKSSGKSKWWQWVTRPVSMIKGHEKALLTPAERCSTSLETLPVRLKCRPTLSSRRLVRAHFHRKPHRFERFTMPDPIRFSFQYQPSAKADPGPRQASTTGKRATGRTQLYFPSIPAAQRSRNE